MIENTLLKEIALLIAEKLIQQDALLERKPIKWIPSGKLKKGSLSKKLGIPESEKIPIGLLRAKKKELSDAAKGPKKLSAANRSLLSQIVLALTFKKFKKKAKKKS